MQAHLGPVSCADLAPFATPSELTVDEGEEIRSVEWLGWDFHSITGVANIEQRPSALLSASV